MHRLPTKQLTGLVLAVALLLAAPGSVQLLAQGGSNYSVFGVGDLYDHVSAVYEGLGGTSIAVPSPYALNSVNPAAVADLETTRIQAAYSFRQIQANTDLRTVSQNNGKIQGLTAGMSIDTALGAGLLFGIRPFSTVNYRFQTTETDVYDDGETVSSSTEFRGSGGLTEFFMGGAIRPVDDLAVGINGVFYIGSINTATITEYGSSLFSAAETRRSFGFSGAGLRLGLAYDVTPRLRLGATATFNTDLDVDVENEYRSNSVTLYGDSTISSVDVSPMPSILGFGASYTVGEFVWAADVLSKDFSSFSVRTGDGQAEFRRSNKVSAGVQWLRTTNAYQRYQDRWTWNFGLSYLQDYYQIRGTGLDEMAASIGVQIPVSERAMLDAALTVGQRGTMDDNLIQERFFRLSFSLSMGDTWFKPFGQR